MSRGAILRAAAQSRRLIGDRARRHRGDADGHGDLGAAWDPAEVATYRVGAAAGALSRRDRPRRDARGQVIGQRGARGASRSVVLDHEGIGELPAGWSPARRSPDWTQRWLRARSARGGDGDHGDAGRVDTTRLHARLRGRAPMPQGKGEQEA
jgi:hypothetical protein